MAARKIILYIHKMDCRAFLIAIASPVLAATTHGQTPRITPLGMIPGWNYADVSAISGDGRYAVGRTYNESTLPRAARWATDGSPPTLMLPYPVSTHEAAYACSADGSVVVGGWGSGNYTFRWTETGGSTNVQPPSGRLLQGLSVSDDGMRGIGYATGTSPGGPLPPLPPQPCLWTLQTGARVIDIPADVSEAQLARISPDGGTAIGLLTPTSTGLRVPAMWSESGGWRTLPSIPGTTFSEGHLVSSGGTVAVLNGFSQGRYVAARWTEEDGTVPITSPAVTGDLLFRGMNLDGSALVGQGQLGLGTAVIWTPGTGLVRLDDYLTSLGLDLTGWTLLSAADVSNDGMTIVGSGVQFFSDGTFRSTQWVVTIPSPTATAVLGAGALVGATRSRRPRS